MIERTYSTMVADEDKANLYAFQHANFIERTLKRLLHRSGAVHTPRSAVLISRRRPELRMDELRIAFDSRAWTGRY